MLECSPDRRPRRRCAVTTFVGLLLLAGGLAGCRTTTSEGVTLNSRGETPEQATYNRKYERMDAAGLLYFRRSFIRDRLPDLQLNAWFGKHLKSMHEPELDTRDFDEADPRMTLRLLILPTFSEPVSLRLEIALQEPPTEAEDGSRTYRVREAELIARQTDGQGGYDAGTLVMDERIPLTPDEAEGYLALLDTMNVGHLPDESPGRLTGFDGTQIVMEVVDTSGYHAIMRQYDWGYLETREIERLQQIMPYFDLGAYYRTNRQLGFLWGTLYHRTSRREENPDDAWTWQTDPVEIRYTRSAGDAEGGVDVGIGDDYDAAYRARRRTAEERAAQRAQGLPEGEAKAE